MLVAHAGFVIIAAGTTLYWALGFSGEFGVGDGQAVRVARTGAVMRLDNFAYRIAPTQTKSGIVYQPIDYVSRVTVSGRDGVARHMTVRVNHPIDVDGTLYYQASYGFGVRFRLEHRGRPDPSVGARTLLEGDSFDVPGTTRSVVYERFVPTVDRSNGMPTADPRVNDPAVASSRYAKRRTAGRGNAAAAQLIDLGDGWRAVAGPLCAL